jgi:hypothetical protein
MCMTNGTRKLAKTGLILAPVCTLLLLPDWLAPAALAQLNDPNRAVLVYAVYTFDDGGSRDPNGPIEPNEVTKPDQVKDPNMYPWGSTPANTPGFIPDHPDYPGRSGLWGLSGAGKHGFLVVDIDNTALSVLKKYVSIEYEAITHGGGTAGPPTAEGPKGSGVRPTDKEDKRMPDGAIKLRFDWVIDPQPAKERIKIPISTGAHDTDYAYVDNVTVYTKCMPRKWTEDPNDPNYPWYKTDTGQGRFHYFDSSDWPPIGYYVVTSPGCDDESWSINGGVIPEWLPAVTDHEAVLGLPGGYPASTDFSVQLEGEFELAAREYVAFQFDYYAAEGGTVAWAPDVSPGCVVENFEQTTEAVGEGWQRVYLTFETVPSPEWLELHWSLSTGDRSGPVVIDNLVMSECSTWRICWADNLDVYEPETGLIGSNGWKGWDNNPATDGRVVEEPANSLFNSLAVWGPTDLVQEFQGFTSGIWELTAWMYVPSGFVSGCDPYNNCGSYLILLNTYHDGGPYNWSVQLHADSVTGSFICDQPTPAHMPLITDAWIKVGVVIDLDLDFYQAYYNGEPLGGPASWTAGVFGGGGGARNIAAVDLYANASTPVFYGDLDLRPVLRGDLNCDDRVNFGDINPFVQRLSAPLAYAEARPFCADANGDINGNGTVGFDDINPFVALLSGRP